MDHRSERLLRHQEQNESGVRYRRVVSEPMQVLVVGTVLPAVSRSSAIQFYAEPDRSVMDGKFRDGGAAQYLEPHHVRGEGIAVGGAWWPLWSAARVESGHSRPRHASRPRHDDSLKKERIGDGYRATHVENCCLDQCCHLDVLFGRQPCPGWSN